MKKILLLAALVCIPFIVQSQSRIGCQTDSVTQRYYCPGVKSEFASSPNPLAAKEKSDRQKIRNFNNERKRTRQRQLRNIMALQRKKTRKQKPYRRFKNAVSNTTLNENKTGKRKTFTKKHLNCSCESDFLSCSNFSKKKAAQKIYQCCMAKVGFDIHQLDEDGDGKACESLL